MKNKRKIIIMRYHITQDIVHAIIVYVCSLVLIYIVYKKMEPFITEDVFNDCYRLSITVVTAVYFIVKYLTIKIRKKKESTLIIDENGNIWNNGILCKVKIVRPLEQLIFGTVNMKIYDAARKKRMKYLKHISNEICKYL